MKIHNIQDNVSVLVSINKAVTDPMLKRKVELKFTGEGTEKSKE